MNRIVIEKDEDLDNIVDFVKKKIPHADVRTIHSPFDKCEIVVYEAETKLSCKLLRDAPCKVQLSLTDTRNGLIMVSYMYDWSILESPLTEIEFCKDTNWRKSVKIFKDQIKPFLERWAWAWICVMIYIQMAKDEVERIATVSAETKKSEKKNSKKKQKPIYIRSYVLTGEVIKDLNRKCKHRKPDHEFGVRGHYRHYRNGRVIWVKPYRKCTGKEQRKDQTYIMEVS